MSEKNAPVAQGTEQLPSKQFVGSSNLSGGIKTKRDTQCPFLFSDEMTRSGFNLVKEFDRFGRHGHALGDERFFKLLEMRNGFTAPTHIRVQTHQPTM